jgi:hypothetical protein
MWGRRGSVRFGDLGWGGFGVLSALHNVLDASLMGNVPVSILLLGGVVDLCIPVLLSLQKA